MTKHIGVMSLFLVGFLIYAHDASFPSLAPLAILSTAVNALCAVFISKRTSRGLRLLEQTEGLRLFLGGEDPAGIEALHREDERCFESMLPCAYMFCMSGEWAGAVSHFRAKRPEWYIGCMRHGHAFEQVEFAALLESTMDTLKYNMTFVVGPRIHNRVGI